MPLSDRDTDDRFYSLRDYHGPLRRDWSRAVPIREGDLVDVTPDAADPGVQAAVPAGAAGWLLRLDSQPGEKAISSSRTIEHTVYFPTFVPASRADEGAGDDEDTCTDPAGSNLLYQVSVFDARPGRYLAETAHATGARGLALRLGQPGIAPEPMFLFPAADGEAGGDRARPPPLCLVGLESCGSVAEIGPHRTYWRQRGAE